MCTFAQAQARYDAQLPEDFYPEDEEVEDELDFDDRKDECGFFDDYEDECDFGDWGLD